MSFAHNPEECHEENWLHFSFVGAAFGVYALSLAQLESSKNTAAKYLLRVMDGPEVRAYYGSAVDGAHAWTGDKALFAVSYTGENAGPVSKGAVMFYDGSAFGQSGIDNSRKRRR
jgi:hypothetical protein